MPLVAAETTLEMQICVQAKQAAVFTKALPNKKFNQTKNNNNDATRQNNNKSKTHKTINETQTATTQKHSNNTCMKAMVKAESALRLAARVSRSACQTFEDTITWV